tara:strand:- start:24637 stop:26313 length:1677 start_codon:yes stop_codon:yes gene_type:complete
MKTISNKNKKFSIFEVENILKKQKIICALWIGSSKKYSHYQLFYIPLKKLFGEAILFDPRKVRFSQGSEQMNKMFLSLVEKEKPDYIFVIVGRDELTIETMEIIKKISPETKIIALVGDDDTQFETLKRYQGIFVDCSFIAQPNYEKNYRKDGIKNTFPTVGVNLDLNKPMNTKKIYDVTFIGAASEPRLDMLRFLVNNKVNLKIFGRGWEIYPEFKDIYFGGLEMEDMIKIINQTKINLALSRNTLGVLHFKGRVFELPACKSFTLVDYFKEYLKYFKKDKEIVMFKNKKDLLKKINYYLKNEKEREKITNNSYKKMRKNHDILITFKKMFKNIMENEGIFSSKMPIIKKKIISLKKEDLHKNFKEIKNLIKNFDYVSFSDGDSLPLKHKDYLQVYSLEKTKKDISCCDYYIYDKILGNYLLVNTQRAFLYFKQDKFNQLISINQLAVSKNYFLNNINRFKGFFDGKKIDIINNKNTCFVSIPLIKNKKINELDYDVFSYTFQKIFIVKTYSLLKQKKLFSSLYFYRLLYFLVKNPLLMRSFIENIKDKRNWNRLRM